MFFLLLLLVMACVILRFNNFSFALVCIISDSYFRSTFSWGLGVIIDWRCFWSVCSFVTWYLC